MNIQSNRTNLKNYALRKLGAPVLQINIAPEQIEDRIDEALKRFWEFHHEGSYIDIVMRQLTQEEIDSKSLVLDDWIYQVIGMVMLQSNYSSFNLEYTAFMQNIGSQLIVFDGSISYGLSSYTISQTYLALVRDFFSREHRIQYNQLHNVVHIHSSMEEYKAGDYIAFEAYRFSNPNDVTEVWDNQWLKDYTTALIKRQWGQNMIKYNGFTMPSGITLNGRDIYQDALADIAQLEQELFSSETLPVDFMVG